MRTCFLRIYIYEMNQTPIRNLRITRLTPIPFLVSHEAMENTSPSVHPVSKQAYSQLFREKGRRHVQDVIELHNKSKNFYYICRSSWLKRILY